MENVILTNRRAADGRSRRASVYCKQIADAILVHVAGSKIVPILDNVFQSVDCKKPAQTISLCHTGAMQNNDRSTTGKRPLSPLRYIDLPYRKLRNKNKCKERK